MQPLTTPFKPIIFHRLHFYSPPSSHTDYLMKIHDCRNYNSIILSRCRCHSNGYASNALFSSLHCHIMQNVMRQCEFVAPSIYINVSIHISFGPKQLFRWAIALIPPVFSRHIRSLSLSLSGSGKKDNRDTICALLSQSDARLSLLSVHESRTAGKQ